MPTRRRKTKTARKRKSRCVAFRLPPRDSKGRFRRTRRKTTRRRRR